LKRRKVLGLTAAGMTSLAGCSQQLRQTVSGTAGDESAATGTVTTGSDPLSDASVTAYRNGNEIARSTTDADGTYDLSFGSFPAWVRFDHPEYSSVTRAIAPGSTRTITLDSGEESVNLTFGGDVMFGRRYYEPRDDPLRFYYRLQPGDRRDSHDRLLNSVSPLFRDADIASINLETPLTTSEWRHPSKAFVFTSHPVAAAAMADSGIDYAALANTHAFDALTPGLEETVASLDEAGVAHSGAGSDPSTAIAPAVLERDGVTVGFVSVTTTAGRQYDRDWAANETTATYTVNRDGQTLSVRDRAGVAEATPETIRASVQAATDRADVVVTQIHGGEEYQRTPTRELQNLTDTAIAAGSDLVVNHHPHVSGGLETRDGALVAWSMGNLFFDQNLWATYRSFVLQVTVTPDGVQSARAEPILIEGYVPRGVTGPLRNRLTWELAGLSDSSFTIADDTVAYRPDDERYPPEQLTLDGGIQRRARGWVTESDDSVQLGRERFITGSFDDHDVDSDAYEGTLWRYGRESRGSDQPIGQDRSGGIELVRVRANENRALLSPWNRLPVSNKDFTLSGTYRTNADGELRLLVSWYDDTAGSSFQSQETSLASTEREWTDFALDLERPDDATHIDVFLLLTPPDGVDILRAAFDTLSLVEWEPADVAGGRQFDAIRGPSGATVRAVPVDGEVRWQ
jgi:poly-gamma-glutamate capsule biosynthesis protein CapA/YwtB (metallophosphatase superfamily)